MGDSAFHNTKRLVFHSKRPVLFLRAWQVNKSNEVALALTTLSVETRELESRTQPRGIRVTTHACYELNDP